MVFEGVAGAADVWLCDLYAVIALNPESPVGPTIPTGFQTNAELFALFADVAVSLPTVKAK
jgi:hypothetical protein